MKFEMKKNENFPRFFFHFKLHFFSFCKLFLLKNLEIPKKPRKTISFQSFSIILQAISIENPRNSKKNLGKSMK